MSQRIRPLLAALLLGLSMAAAAQPAPAAEPDKRNNGVVASVSESISRGWDATRDGIGHAVEITREKVGQGWEKTQEVAGATADWTREKSRRAWTASRDGAAATSQWVREKAGRPETAAGEPEKTR